MARLLLALYLPFCMLGSSGFVLCMESDSSMVLEWGLEGCCETVSEIQSPTGSPEILSTKDCACTDFSASMLLAQRLVLHSLGLSLPAPALAVLQPEQELSVIAAARFRLALQDGERTRPDLPGAGACPRVLRN